MLYWTWYDELTLLAGKSLSDQADDKSNEDNAGLEIIIQGGAEATHVFQNKWLSSIQLLFTFCYIK